MKIIPIITGLIGAGASYYGTNKAKMPQGLQIASAVVGGAGGYYTGTKISTLFGKNASKEFVGSVQTEAEKILKNNLKLPPEQQVTPTYSPAQMKAYANSLFTAMDGAGTQSKEVAKVFSAMKNDLDIYYLIDAFGTRAGSSWFATSSPEDLATWLQSDGETEAVNKILATKAKITFRF